MKVFDNSMEALVIKYTLGTMFVAVFVIFGVKMIILLGTVAKMKIAGLLGEGVAEFLFDEGGLLKLLKK